MDDEEMQQIRRAVDESKQQFVVNHGDEQRRMRESAIAARSGAIARDGKQYQNSAVPGGPEPKKPMAGVPKGIPMTMIVSQPADQDGGPVQFVPGELQETEAKQKVAETRLPTLPALPRTEGFRDHVEKESGGASILVETAAGQAAIELPGTDQPDLSDTSVLEQYPGFYVHCKPFLPKASPEQHFQVFGVHHQLSREEWEVFVRSGTENL